LQFRIVLRERWRSWYGFARDDGRDLHRINNGLPQIVIILRTVAYRILESAGEADNAVQECWLRVSRADGSATENLEGWNATYRE
jgi:DNA-directed RNA polymerase specialized sigma24 family protein